MGSNEQRGDYSPTDKAVCRQRNQAHPDTPMSKGHPNFLYSIQVCFEIGSLEFLVGLKLTKVSYSRGLHYHTYSKGNAR